jgi:hypothetical protein
MNKRNREEEDVPTPSITTALTAALIKLVAAMSTSDDAPGLIVQVHEAYPLIRETTLQFNDTLSWEQSAFSNRCVSAW